MAKKNKKRTRKSVKKPSSDATPVHPWRVCPYGEHQVITHPRLNPPSKSHPDGSVSTVHWHCAKNPSHKDQLYPDEIREIANQHFSSVKNKFNDKKNSNSARGLMQITNETRKLLNNPKELKDHYLDVTKEDLNDPVINICAGVRWLFRKKEIASVIRLKRQATWIEAAEEYKGDLEGILNGSPQSQKDVDGFLNYLKEVEKCGK